ncbi:dihydrofolate reductase family protein [Amycolatopsis sp. A133]|uniref:dihydrofolate reductase family protein n=1 Tax=Amycolatopsis sp. A133 TaxID=3064472 RepID=UPI0027F4F17D|nr:dihydrofolate reductase family protein [Amycolatopsis sp. A133]MDQ7806762.1 dihydrofolate reductase family protein [Amycolatopsis sp. A133]
MREVVLYLQMTLDGRIEGPAGAMDWIRVDDDTWRVVGELQERADTAVLGRATYEQFLTHWPATATDPTASGGAGEHARWLEKTPKLVCSRTPHEPGWVNARAVPEAAAAIGALRAQPGGDVLVLGGVGLAQSLVTAGLVDEYRLLVNPVVLGRGRKLFGTFSERMDLELVSAEAFGSGVVSLCYRRS